MTKSNATNNTMGNAPFGAIVWPFAFSQTISWAALFYIFPALLGQWEMDFGWTKTQISGALTCALILSALCAPISGRIIDKGYFVALHVGGSIIGVLLLVALSFVHTLWQFYLIWSLIGIVMSSVLYEPCFAILTRTFDARARAAIIRVTLIAGLAGTVAFPAAHVLNGLYGWRDTILIFASVMALIAVPLAWSASSKAQHHAKSIVSQRDENTRSALLVTRSMTFWFLVLAYIAFALNHSMIITHILPLLDDRGLPPSSAILAASFIGPMQVAGRIAMMSVEKYISIVAVATIAAGALMLAAACLFWVNLWVGLAVLFVILQGAGNGISSIVRPLLTAQLLGKRNFGLVSGIMAIPFIGGFAAGPFISALTWNQYGYDGVLIFAATICVIGIASLLIAAKLSTANA